MFHFTDLASLLPRQLNLSSPGASRFEELLSAASHELSWSAQMDASDLLPIAERFPPISDVQACQVAEFLTQNEVGLRIGASALQFDDLCVSAPATYGAFRNTPYFTGLLKASELIGTLWILLARIRIRDRRLSDAANVLIRVIKLARILYRGAGDIAWFECAKRLMGYAMSVIDEFLLNSSGAEGLENIIEALDCIDTCLVAYLGAMVSDDIRDLVVTLADPRNNNTSGNAVTRILNSPYCSSLYGRARGYKLDQVDQFRPSEEKVKAIIEVVSRSAPPLDVVETIKAIAQSYDDWCVRFRYDLSATMISGLENVAPELQFTSEASHGRCDAVTAESLAVCSRNALGLLLVGDIVAVANVAARRLLVVAWGASLEISVARVKLAIAIFERVRGVRVRSINQLCDDGPLARPPVDLLSHAPLEYLPDDRLVIDPSREEVCKLLECPADLLFELKWAVPPARDAGHTK